MEALKPLLFQASSLAVSGNLSLMTCANFWVQFSWVSCFFGLSRVMNNLGVSLFAAEIANLFHVAEGPSPNSRATRELSTSLSSHPVCRRT